MSDRTLTDQQIMNAMAKLDTRVNYCGENTMQLGLYLEYVIEKIKTTVDVDGNPLINLDLEEEFFIFAERRKEEINIQVEDIKNAMKKKKGMNLDDTTGQ